MSQSNYFSIRNLKVFFPPTNAVSIFNFWKHSKTSSTSGDKYKNYVKAVNDVSFNLSDSEHVAVVGESGSGKSTLARAMLRLQDFVDGDILWQGKSITALKGRELKNFRKHNQIIFQDPYNSLNPSLRVDTILGEGLRLNDNLNAKETQRAILQMLDLVGLDESALKKYPHEFSGGQRQRINIARVLLLKPSFVICDEPVSSLDVSIQAQIINLLLELSQAQKCTYFFITHNIAIVPYVARYVIVMYQGAIMEMGEVDTVLPAPKHPYTKLLLASVPSFDKKLGDNPYITTSTPSKNDNDKKQSTELTGCPFANRCPVVEPRCHQTTPSLKPCGTRSTQAGFPNLAACHLL